jgi:glycosyltransferase involved in cell wall biosynthesis
MKQKIAMLLNGPIFNDYRVVKMIQTLSTEAKIDLYYIDGNEQIDKALFNEQVRLFSIQQSDSFKRKLLKHSLFCYEFNFLIKAVLDKDIDYNYVWCNDLPTLNAGYNISKKLNTRLIYDSHEIFVETINQFFPKKSNFIKLFIFRLLIFIMKTHGRIVEKKILQRVDSFITVNESILTYFKEKYTINKGYVVMNLPRISDTNFSTEIIDFCKLYNWDKSSKILLYQGVLNHGRGLELLIETIAILPKEYKLIILGNGPLLNSLIAKKENYNLNESIEFINMVKLSELPKFTRGATLGVNLLEAFNLSKKLASPNKLFEYIHAGIPVIASDTIENKIVINQFNIGIVTSNDTFSIKQKILSISDYDHKRYKENTVSAAKHYNWENQEKTILDVIMDISSTKEQSVINYLALTLQKEKNY